MQELTVVERVGELAAASGKALEFEVQELNKLAEKSKTITSIEDENFKEVKAEMVKKRNYIKQYCLDARRDIKKVAEGVSEVEEMLYEIFVPEENRLIAIAEEDKAAKELETRKKALPARIAQLETIGDEVLETKEPDFEQFLLGMDSKQFEAYYNQRVVAKNAADRAELERREAALKEKEEAAKREEEAKAREEKARQDEREKIEREAKEKEEREAREKKEAEERQAEQERIHQEQLEKEKQAELDRIEAEKKEEAEKKRKLEASKKFQTWLQKQGYSEETKSEFKLVDNGDSVTLYKLVGNYKK